jgi:hypothetical protein
VLRVIELHVEALVEARGKTPQRRIVALRIRVAYQTHRNRGRRELSTMTVSARFVTGEAWRRRVVSPLVTGSAGKGTVTLARMQKLRVVDLGALREHKDCNTEDTDNHLTSLRFSGGRSAIR